MNSEPVHPEPAPPSAVCAPQVSNVQVDASCAMPVLYFFTKALAWLLVAVVLGLLASIKLHSGTFLAGISWLTYGRVQAASLDVLAYGFASQAVFGMALWMLARLGNAPLQGGRWILLGGGLWNLGVLAGLVGILAGHGTGYEWNEFPRYASFLLLLGYGFIGVCALITFCSRTRCELFVSQWFLLAGLLWFPWIYSTAQLLLFVWPVRGVMQAVVNQWYIHNFFGIWLAAGGLAALFYLLPKLLDRPLFSHGLAMVAFWVLAVFGTWGGVYPASPMPKWLSSVSVVGNFMTAIALAAIATILFKTSLGYWKQIRSWTVLRFVMAGAASFMVAKALGILGTFRSVSELTHLTTYADAVRHLELYGFIGFTLAGMVYYLVPKLTQIEWPSIRLIRFHFWASIAGVLLIFAGLLVAGLRLGSGINQVEVSYLVLARGLIPFLGLATLGLMLVAAGYLAMLVNLAGVGRVFARRCCRSEAAVPESSAAGVRV